MLFEAEGLGYRYDDGTPALEAVTFDVEAGDQLAVLGANGSGKSTLLRLLNGLLFPSAGVLRFRGRNLSEAAFKTAEFRTEFRQSVGFVFQNADAQLFNPTVFEELAFGPRQLGLPEAIVTQRVRDILDFIGIPHLADRPPFRLSGGEKRKVAISSVLSMNPDVLLFDEPFLGLDPRSQAWLVGTIRQLQEAGKTTIIATHTLDKLPLVAEKLILLSEEHTVEAVTIVETGLRDLAMLRRANLIGETDAILK
ncbi:MAG TPA: ABC transporter ATP-binding protein [Fimbriimonadaceae bacterium]|nr:ABC transporter ATP-binding protein [Fimbriimonadaceae bacterium]